MKKLMLLFSGLFWLGLTTIMAAELPVRSYTVIPATNRVPVGQPFTVKWKTPATADLHLDWVLVYPKGKSSKSYVKHAFVTDNQPNPNLKEGTITFILDAAGTYYIQYFDHNDATVDRSNPVEIEVVAEGKYQLTVTPSIGLPGQHVLVHWVSDPATRLGNDAIVLYASTPFPYISYAWVEGEHDSYVSFNLPDFVGTYYVAYIKNENFTDLSVPPVRVEVVGSFGTNYSVSLSTNQMFVGETVDLTFTSPKQKDNSGDSIRLARVGSDLTEDVQVRYIFLDLGQWAFVIQEQGDYEVRYFNANGEKVAVSQVLRVLPLPPPGNNTGAPALAIQKVEAEAIAVTLQSSVPGKSYDLLHSEDLTGTNWQCIKTVIGTGGQMSVGLSKTAKSGFFRVVETPPSPQN